MESRREIINLSTVFERSVFSRSSVSSVLSHLRFKENLHVILDFNNISFFSRSAAQQLEIEKSLYSERKITFEFINLEPQVNLMIDIASHRKERKNIEINVIETTDADTLESIYASF